MLRYVALHSIAGYIRFHVQSINSRRSEIMPVGEPLIMHACYGRKKMPSTAWFKKWRHSHRRQDANAKAYARFKYVPFERPFEQFEY